MNQRSPLQSLRLSYAPPLPKMLRNLESCTVKSLPDAVFSLHPRIETLFPRTKTNEPLTFIECPATVQSALLKVGVLLSGGQAAGGHNVIAGLFDALQKIAPGSQLIGFSDGMNGLLEERWLEINSALLGSYRNQGGFDLLGSSRRKMDSREDWERVKKTVTRLGLNGLIIIGGDDSNTNAAKLAEEFVQSHMRVSVIGVPKTIDGDLTNEWTEASFGFDTACKVYAELIGNLGKDACSSKKYYYFVRLMGRSASHVTLECALKTQPNLALIGEEIAAKSWGLDQIVDQIADLIATRAAIGKDYGVILIPEGILECIPGFQEQLEEMQTQLALEKDSHGNIQVSKIETERFLIPLVEQKLSKMKAEGRYQGKFNPQPLFYGYEGRSALPTNFDASYAYGLGVVSALLVREQKTGYLAGLRFLKRPIEEWVPFGVPLVRLLRMEKRGNREEAVIEKKLVNLNGPIFELFAARRASWREEDLYLVPGPIQFFPQGDIADSIPLTLYLS